MNITNEEATKAVVHQITPPELKFIPNVDTTAKRDRSSGLDIVRTIACISVIASHYFLFTNFKTYEFSGLSMYLQGMLASIVVGSDLYMILTGFLCCNKTIGRKFYLSGIKVLLSYVFFSILTIVVNIYIFHTGMTWKSGLLGILSFSTIPYAWYIEMWIGLFLMAPFLNIWYKALPSKKTKLWLIVLLFSLSALPDFFNRYGMYVMPQYWVSIYPIAFYFTGCFIREYRPTVSKKSLALIIVTIALIPSTVTLIAGHSTFLHIIGGRNGYFIGTITIAIFMMFYKVDIKKRSIKGIFKMISLRSLDIFLCSAVFDYYLYPLFKENFYENQSQFGIFYFVIVPTIFVICYITASIKRLLFSAIGIVLKKGGINIAIQSHS